MNFNDLLPILENALQLVGQQLEQRIKDEVAKALEQHNGKLVKLTYNLDEVEQVTGITRLGLKGRIKRGTVQAFKDGNTWLITSDEVMRIVNQQQHKKRA